MISEMISGLNSELDCCFEAESLNLLMAAVSSNELKLLEKLGKGVKLKCVTEITADNLSLCKALSKTFELYHISGLAGCFAIADGLEYIGYLEGRDAKQSILRISNPSFVTGQLFLMKAILGSALPARQRIIEIVKGSENEFIETIKDPLKTKSLLKDLISSAEYEVDILFSTSNSFLMAERDGILDELGQAAKRGTKVKVLVMRDEAVKEISDAKLKAAYGEIQVNYLLQFLPTKITTLIVDQSRTLTIEVNDDTKETLQESIGLSTYANSESTVFSNSSIFESLWIQSEIDKQNKARLAYFQLFKGFKLKDEKYDRRWSTARREDTGDG